MQWRVHSLSPQRPAIVLGPLLSVLVFAWCGAVRAQAPPVPLTREKVTRPGTGEIALQGTIQEVAADKRHLTLLVTQVGAPGGKTTTLAAPRPKEIEIAVGAAVFRVNGETDSAPVDTDTLDALTPAITVLCLGANSGEGNPLLARTLVIIKDPAHDAMKAAQARLQVGKNLLPPLSNREAWWVLPIGGKTRAETEMEEGALKINVLAVDDQDWHVLFSPRNATELVSGATYKLSFQAKADKEHPYVIQSQINQGDYHNTGLFKPFTITADWKPYEFTFTAHNTVLGHDSCPIFALGKEVGTIYFKDMKLEAIDTNVDPGNLLRPIADPKGWTLLLMRGAQATLEREKDSLRVTVSKGTGRNQDAQVVQYGIALKEGEWYTVRFRARSPVERTIRVSSGVSRQPYHDLGLEREIKVGTVEKTFVLTFQAKKPQSWPDGLNLAPSFLIGDTPGTLWLSRIVVVPGKATEQL